jgi:hypothetical protein
MTKKQKITVEFEFEIFEEEGGYQEVVGFNPVFIDAGEVSEDDLKLLLRHLKEDEDVAFDINWELNALLSSFWD